MGLPAGKPARLDRAQKKEGEEGGEGVSKNMVKNRVPSTTNDGRTVQSQIRVEGTLC